jgi:hypothetical protein
VAALGLKKPVLCADSQGWAALLENRKMPDSLTFSLTSMHRVRDPPERRQAPMVEDSEPAFSIVERVKGS